ncbi:MAG: hypothetical protein NT118_03005, partial [Lentisphaerae bacterium]|nr:hypothetical protein [Lentisphaerota bacterium]
MGTEGYALVRILEPGVNPELKFVPLKTDTTCTAAGKQSLKIENKDGEFFELHTKEFQLKPNTDYTISVTAKSELNNTPIRVIIYNINGIKWNVHAQMYQLTPEFKTYSWSFNTGDAGTAWHIQIPPGLHYNPN